MLNGTCSYTDCGGKLLYATLFLLSLKEATIALQKGPLVLQGLGLGMGIMQDKETKQPLIERQNNLFIPCHEVLKSFWPNLSKHLKMCFLI